MLGSGDVVASWTADRFDMFRALSWTGDVDRIVPLVSRYGLPGTDLIET